ncbi:glycosyltransferase family 2 protein [Hanstruepera flava]|uniref:glycosyltransferase family 2 protein n=1 Tax=Hanstruepera flava TaxID=2930218 RepID=UPI002028DCFD|nr:glycosyltransferase family 2 protein [Hanstruepera flava]
MKIAVVILNWNGKTLLEQFIPSVISYSNEADVYLADNASTDNSVDYVKTHFPTINIIQNTENGGYAKGYNEALKQIKADVYCLLNSDVEVTKNWLQPVIEEFESNPETSIIQPKILDYKNKDFFEYAGAAGGFIDKYGYPYCRGRIFNTIEKDSRQYNDNVEIFWASGACFFIKAQVFKNLNGFDESFFAHMEEIDLCWRAFNKGYVTKYVGDSTIYHLGGATLKNTNPKKTYLNFRNSLFTLVKNAKGNLLSLVFTRLLLDGVAGVKFLFEFKFGHILAIIKAHFSFYINLPRLLNTRKQLLQKGNYFQTKSIVWRYYMKNIKTF